ERFSCNDTRTTTPSTPSLHDALPILIARSAPQPSRARPTADASANSITAALYSASQVPRDSPPPAMPRASTQPWPRLASRRSRRSEEHTSELQSRENLVCRLLLEKKK